MADKLDQVAIRMIEQPPLYSDSPYGTVRKRQSE